jgi:hypothetical protein
MFRDILQYLFTIIANLLGATALILTYVAQLCRYFENEFENIVEAVGNAPIHLNLIPEPYEIFPEDTPTEF